jgi:hypothetical protein
LAFPLAIGVAALAQIAVEGPLALGLQSVVGYRGWTIWLAKCVAAFLVGGSFVTVAWVVAPNRRHIAATGALGVVVLWGATLIVGSISPRIAPWVIAIGALGLLGGITAFGVGHHAFTPKRAV